MEELSLSQMKMCSNFLLCGGNSAGVGWAGETWAFLGQGMAGPKRHGRLSVIRLSEGVAVMKKIQSEAPPSPFSVYPNFMENRLGEWAGMRQRTGLPVFSTTSGRGMGFRHSWKFLGMT